jgi:hypothetical protein
METEYSLRNVVFEVKTGQWIMSRNTIFILLTVLSCHLQAEAPKNKVIQLLPHDKL